MRPGPFHKPTLTFTNPDVSFKSIEFRLESIVYHEATPGTGVAPAWTVRLAAADETAVAEGEGSTLFGAIEAAAKSLVRSQ